MQLRTRAHARGTPAAGAHGYEELPDDEPDFVVVNGPGRHPTDQDGARAMRSARTKSELIREPCNVEEGPAIYIVIKGYGRGLRTYRVPQ